MAEFHMNIAVAARAEGSSSVAGAAYISRSRILDERVGLVRDFRRCHSHERLVADLGVSLPEGAPARWADRAELWNEVERVESSPRAQLCRRVELALPVELDERGRLALAKSIVGLFTEQGMVVDACVHDALDGHNPHLHMLMPMRACGADGFLPKSENEYLVRSAWGVEAWMSAAALRRANTDGGSWAKVHRWERAGERLELTDREAESLGGCRRVTKAPVQRTRYLVDWNERSKAEEWRAAVAGLCNEALREAGRAERVDHRSYARRGVPRVPTEHEGPAAYAAERRLADARRAKGLARRFATARRARNARARKLNRLFALLIDELLAQAGITERRGDIMRARATGIGVAASRRAARQARASSRGRGGGRRFDL